MEKKWGKDSKHLVSQVYEDLYETDLQHYQTRMTVFLDRFPTFSSKHDTQTRWNTEQEQAEE
jgi:hypothetical protein